MQNFKKSQETLRKLTRLQEELGTMLASEKLNSARNCFAVVRAPSLALCLSHNNGSFRLRSRVFRLSRRPNARRRESSSNASDNCENWQRADKADDCCRVITASLLVRSWLS
jgi:hypothetical protein